MVKIWSISENDTTMTLNIQAQYKAFHFDEIHFHLSVESIDSLRHSELEFFDVPENDTNIIYKHMEILKETKSPIGIPSEPLEMTKLAFKTHIFTGEPEYAYQNTIFKKTINIYPHGKENVMKFVSCYDKPENAIVDNDKLYASIISLEEDKYSHYVHINGFFINKLNKDQSLYLNDGEINGMPINFERNYYDLTDMPAGCSGYFSYGLSQQLNDLGLDSIKDIKTLKIILPKEITSRNKTIDINKDMLIFR